LRRLAKVLRHVREDVRRLAAYVAGATREEVARRHGLEESKVIKLASNENPYGPSPKAVEAVIRHASEVNMYPENHPAELVEAISSYLHLPGEMIIPGGNGADEVMETVMKLVITRGDEAVLHTPTFPYYRLLLTVYGSRVVEVPMEPGFRFPVEAMLKAITPRTRLVIICSPNNPTGTVMEERDLRRLLDTGVLVMLDEAYVEFADRSCTRLVESYDNLVVLRTFSKAFALAGLRVGYGVAAEELVAQALKVKPPHSVSLLAIKAACAALSDLEHVRSAVEKIKKERGRAYKAFSQLPGMDVVPSQANFHLLSLKGRSAREVVQALEKKGIMVRDCTAFGLPQGIRATVGRREENTALLKALEEALRNKVY